MSSWVKEGRLQASVKRQLKERREGGLERLDGGEDKVRPSNPYPIRFLDIVTIELVTWVLLIVSFPLSLIQRN